MTLVASWISKEDSPNLVWTIADTQITGTERTLTLEGSKVLELNMRCCNLTTKPGNVYYSTSLGFAYAGSSLVGLNTYATLQTMLSSLGGGSTEHMRVPDYHSVVSKARDILKLYVSAIQDLAEITIWGYCPKYKHPFIGHVKAVKENDVFEFIINFELGSSDVISPITMGNHSPAFEELLATHLKQYNRSDYRYWRCPIAALDDMIKSSNYAGIGGSIQLAHIQGSGFFTPLAYVSQLSDSDRSIRYRNFDMFHDLGNVMGDCYIAIPAVFL